MFDRKVNWANQKKKSTLIFILCVIVLIAMAVFIPAAENRKDQVTVLSGSGLKEDPFQITDLEEFLFFASSVNAGNSYAGQYVTLCTDLNLESVANWPMIGVADSGIHFSGIFDGASHKIQNLNISTTGTAGLFVNLDGVVSNLSIVNGTVQGNVCGAIAGSATENAAILNSYNMAVVNGENAGGIAGTCSGTIINCVNLAPDGAENIAGNTEGGIVINCYTNKGGNFEIKNHTSLEADSKIRKKAVSNLNDMINELSIKYALSEWYLWQLTDNVPTLTSTAANTLMSASMEAADGNVSQAQYSETDHTWYFEVPGDISEKDWNIQFQFKDGVSESLTCDSKYNVIYYTYDNITYPIECRPAEQAEDQEVNTQLNTEPFTINLNNCSVAPESNGIKIIHEVYMGQNGEFQDSTDSVVIARPGIYTIQGKMKGQLSVDLGADAIYDGNAKVTLILDGTDIINQYGPAITIKNVLETGDIEIPGINIVLADTSDNTIYGSDSMDIYSSDNKSEGAISTNMTMTINGNDGKINITGALEGIESNAELAFNGGTYYIDSNDDGINTAKHLTINSGYFVINANDDVLDTNENITINGGTIIGFTPTEHVLNASDGTKVNGGLLIGSSSFTNDCKDNSEQGLIELQSDSMFESGQKIVMTDEKNEALSAFEIQADGNNLAISIPEMRGNVYHFYSSTNVSGIWKDGFCTEITGYVPDKSLTHDGTADFSIDAICNTFTVDNE